ncbi:TVP38/TMEM64 family protein [Parasporobacterium paucivorans]|uniref:TVP38/TMEM64 family membrane protein n=1 Tax=Parasporobacterium paucivorans DSM 15970 TaxID=1122934 RepID=A0A1M6HB20_9FIRM|nr:VTT domain-containing protein [Parasporobacterium paucivorans]SHJ19313.1 Uncharacterized membrane protein YdjX, TVP38/TMEM64 family, SNARE-associated domain [Parasporobacterium paucivorans DSM 15970]
MRKNKADRIDIIKYTLILLTLIGIGVLLFKFSPWIIQEIKHPGALRTFVQSYGGFGFVVFILLQTLNVMTVFIPADVILNLLGGYVYGAPMVFLLSMIGIMFGAICAFRISRLLGSDLIKRFVSQDRINHISNMLNSKNGFIGMLIVYLIPGIPKDLMMYVAGFMPVKASRLFVVYFISRIPATLIEASIGAQIHERNKMGIIMTSIGLIIFIVVVIRLQIIYKKNSFSKQKEK